MHWWEVQIAQKFCTATVMRFKCACYDDEIIDSFEKTHHNSLLTTSIAKVASRYLHLFLSCNAPLYGRTRWCARCSKCCFVQLLLSAW
jgi:hypothetical protein